MLGFNEGLGSRGFRVQAFRVEELLGVCRVSG